MRVKYELILRGFNNLLQLLGRQSSLKHNFHEMILFIQYGDSIMNPVEMCVYVMRLNDQLLNGF